MKAYKLVEQWKKESNDWTFTPVVRWADKACEELRFLIAENEALREEIDNLMAERLLGRPL